MSRRTSVTQWRTRNTLYLRISRDCVLSMLLYLDPTHLAWMNDLVLERVLENLRQRIKVKLRKESGHKKSIVDVYRGAGWQMAYYFRRTAQKHAVLLKDKQIIMEGHNQPKVSTVKQPFDMDINIDDEESSPASMPPPMEDSLIGEDEEKTLKPKLEVNYAGFAIFGRTLVVVVEPYPPLTEQQIRETSIAPATETRELSAHPPVRARAESSMPPPEIAKAGTPLFRAETPLSVIDPEEDLEGFRARSHSVARTFDIDDELENDELETSISSQQKKSESLISRLGDARNESKAPSDLSIRQYLSSPPE